MGIGTIYELAKVYCNSHYVGKSKGPTEYISTTLLQSNAAIMANYVQSTFFVFPKNVLNNETETEV